ncbi:MAG: hypothetical protein ACK5HZ_14815 [Macellibacteroides fermentans]|uniref:hypothetical protein n=1 Tax=Macellibacteroides fermentans TaxID=879969 RepID=UPI003ACFC2CB
MKNHYEALLFKVVLSILLIPTFSCTNNLPEVNFAETNNAKVDTRSAISSEFFVANGYLHFNNQCSYEKVFKEIFSLDKESLLSWSAKNNFTSLLSYYEKNDSIDQYRVADIVSATLFNEEGLLSIGDSLYQVVNDYVYIIKENNYRVVNAIKENPENFKSSRFKHTEYLVPFQGTKSVSDGSRSYVIQVNRKRREYANFEVSKSINAIGLAIVNIKLIGRAQKKGLWWGTSFNDEMDWGQIVCNGMLINDKVPVKGVIGPKVTNSVSTSISIPLTADNIITNLRVNVTFNFCKNVIKGDESYSHIYVNP